MQASGAIQASLGGRYATALFELARDENAIDAVAESLATLKAALAESADLRVLTKSPLVKRDAAAKAIAAVSASLGLDGTTTKFLGVLARNGRLSQLGAIIRFYQGLVSRHYNRINAEVVSAHLLAQDQVSTLKSTLASRFGREITVDLSVDPAILGGLVVKVGSQQIDSSIRTKLNNLAHAMKG